MKRSIQIVLAGLLILLLWGLVGRRPISFLCPSKPARGAAAPVVEPGVLNLQDSFSRVAAQSKPAVVSISTVHVESEEYVPYEFYFGDPFNDFFEDYFGSEGPSRSVPRRRMNPPKIQRKFKGMGSGVIIDAKGYILTNEHVIRDANEIKVTVMDPDEKIYTGKVVGSDSRTDLAVIRIKAGKDFSSLPLADSDKVRVGDWAIAVGSPFGLEHTVTVGVISAVRQSLSIEGKNFKNLLQTDAAINQGNSGGPLLNIQGEVIGINTAIYAPTGVFAGVGFAIPVNRAREILTDLIEKGKVVRGWMGVEIAPLNDVLSRQFKISDGKGVLINSVMRGSPAEKAGLKRGDVVRQFAGMTVENAESLQDAVAKTPPKKRVQIKIIRQGQEQTLELVTGEMPSGSEPSSSDSDEKQDKTEPDTEEKIWEGAVLKTSSAALAKRLGAPDSAGVLVMQVRPGSVAEEMELVEGDLILGVNGTPTPDLTSFLKIAEANSLKKGIVLDVNRQGRPLYLSYQKAD
ncbi:MAG TPA: Do family serine endopeptidase [Elusimicrobiota bacterium]|nr:Do family serine endopeptidase [Elusimicrobiota bacterium]